jgi:hypothetical protein
MTDECRCGYLWQLAFPTAETSAVSNPPGSLKDLFEMLVVFYALMLYLFVLVRSTRASTTESESRIWRCLRIT